MKKILPISIFVLILIFILLLGLQNMLSKNNSGGVSSVTPTIFQGRQGNEYTTQTGKSNGVSVSPIVPEELKQKLPIVSPDFTLDYSDRVQKYVVTPKTSDGKAAYDQWLSQNQFLAPLLPAGQVVIALQPEEVQKKLPIISPDFTLSYSPRMQKYVVTLKTGSGQATYDQWLAQNPSYINELQAPIVTEQTVEELHAALDYAEKNKLSPEQEFKKNTDAILSLINTLFAPIAAPEKLTPLPSLTPTPLPSSTPSQTPTSVPTELPITTPTSDLLPNPLSPISDKALRFKQSVEPCIANRPVYETTSSQTGVPWEILAAIHYIEGSCGNNQSLVSGREIGTDEPDIDRGGGCSSGAAGPGIPIPLPGGGCGFNTLLDSAIYAGNHIKGKIGKIPSNFQELAKAFSRYNGGGNSNCGSTPYPYCPELFEGEDDAYVVNYIDEKHGTMYLVYCADLTKCNPPRIYTRPGAATIIRLVTNQL